MDDSWHDLSRRVQAKLGQPLPTPPPRDPATPEFLELLSRLRKADPDLAEAVISSYTGTVDPLPSEAEAAAERRRQRLVRWLFARFVRPDGLRTGRARLNLRRVFRYAAAAVAILLIIWSLAPKTPRASQVRNESSSALRVVRSSASSPPLLSPSSSMTTARAQSSALRRLDPVLPLTNSHATRSPGSPPTGKHEKQLMALPIVLFDASSLQEKVSPPAVTPLSAASSQQQPVAVIVYEFGSPSAAGVHPINSYSSPTGPITLPPPAFARGQLLQGKLVTPVIVSSSRGPAPALVQLAQGSVQGTVLLGQATRSPDGRVLISFTELIDSDGKAHLFKGVAYDQESGRVGIGGQTTTMMPDAASALLSAALQSVGDYLTLRPRQGSAVPGSPGVSSAWDAFASRVARAFAPSTEATNGPTVVTRVDRDQDVTILVL